MSLPARIRVNATFPFPSLVQGTGPVTISKSGGIWNIGFSIDALGRQTPTVPQSATDFLIVWDSISQTFFKIAIADMLASVIVAPTVRVQRLATVSPVGVNSGDNIINVNISTGSPTCTLPAAATRAGVAVTFKDVGGHWGTNNMTFSCTGGELIDGAATVVATLAYGAFTFVPANDGTSVGWSIE